MYLRIYLDDLKNEEAIGDVATILVGSVNGSITLNNQEQYVSVGASVTEIKIGLDKIKKFLNK